jgi:amino-acid N-acetyltransferase
VSGRTPVQIRRARTPDVPAIRSLVERYARANILLGKSRVALYEDVQEFWVAEREDTGEIVGCGALHPMWQDLAEVRTVAVEPSVRGTGVGSRLVEKLLETARWLGIERVFVLTFEVEFFARHGFEPIEGAPVEPHVYEELLQSFDAGVAEFLDLESAKPNTLGNTRMLLHL